MKLRIFHCAIVPVVAIALCSGTFVDARETVYGPDRTCEASVAAESVAQSRSRKDLKEASPASSQARVFENVSYRDTGSVYTLERCKLDIYVPAGISVHDDVMASDTSGKRVSDKKQSAASSDASVTSAPSGISAAGLPVVVWFHGGGMTGGNKFIPEQLKDGSCVVVAVNYRLMPAVGIDECIDDAAAAVAWVFRNISRYGGRADKIIVSGHSAGGYLTSMIGLDKSRLAPYGIDADSIAALIPFSGQAVCHFAYREGLGIEPWRPLVDASAPLYHVRADAPLYVIVSGDRELEMLGRYEENAYMWRMMKVAGHTRSYIYELDGYDHAAMAAPAFHILKYWMKRICEE